MDIHGPFLFMLGKEIEQEGAGLFGNLIMVKQVAEHYHHHNHQHIDIQQVKSMVQLTPWPS